MPQLFIASGRNAEAEALVKRFHYSRRVPSNVQLVVTWHEAGGLFGDLGECAAAVLFTVPATRWSEEVWELARLVRRDDIAPSLTGLIATAARIAARSMDLLVSFADATHGHHGGIYQAASWQYDGQREASMDGCIIGGRFVPGRVCNHRFGTRSPERLAERGIIAEPHYDEGKHLYWRALSRSGKAKAARLKLQSNPYPKPDAP